MFCWFFADFFFLALMFFVCFNYIFRFFYFSACTVGNRLQSGPLPIINRVTTPINGLINGQLGVQPLSVQLESCLSLVRVHSAPPWKADSETTTHEFPLQTSDQAVKAQAADGQGMAVHLCLGRHFVVFFPPGVRSGSLMIKDFLLVFWVP